MAKRRRDHAEYIYGLNPVAEALNGRRSHVKLHVREQRRDDRRVSIIIHIAERKGLPINFTDQETLDTRSDRGNHQGVVLETGPFQYDELNTIIEKARNRTILVLDHVQDPQNLATLIRTAAAVDAAGIVIQSDRSAQVTPAVVRSSAGLVEQMHIAREHNTRRTLDTLKENGYWAIALESVDESEDIFTADIPLPAVLVVGSEERGISNNVLKACDKSIMLPMPGKVESLNVAVAGSIALYELMRRGVAESQ